MKILICGSMQFSEKMLEVQKFLKQNRHDAIVSKTIQPFLGKSDGEKEKIKMQQKFNEDAMREYYDLMPGADA
ncbi:MAG: hypothetical protein Q8P20_02120, partial [bacterium]|nr:hypothetical protein [bacterium]